MKKIKIVIDYRERNNLLYDILQQNPDVILERGNLKVGDFLIEDRLLVERKTLKDFVASIKDGRIFNQAGCLASAHKVNLIICEGYSADIKNIKIKKEVIQGALLCLSLRFRLPVIRSGSPQETGKLLLAAYRQTVDFGIRPTSFHYRPRMQKLNRKLKQQIYILQGFPGIGPVRAYRLLEKFKTLQAVVNASHTELASVKGIGRNLAGSITHVLNEEKIVYGARRDNFP